MTSSEAWAKYEDYKKKEEKYRKIVADVTACLSKIDSRTYAFESFGNIFNVMRDSANMDPSCGKFEETYSDGMTLLVSDFDKMVLKMESGIAQLRTKLAAANSLVTYYQNAKNQAYSDYQDALRREEEERKAAEEAAAVAEAAAQAAANAAKAAV